MDAVLASKIVQSGWLNLAFWAHHSISGVKIQQALFRIPHPSKIKNILCAHMHAHVYLFQRFGNALRLPHQLLHILLCPRDLFKTLAPPTSLQLLKTRRVRYGTCVTSPLQTQETHSESKIARTHKDIWTEPTTWDEIWSGPSFQPEQKENAKLRV